LEEVNQLNVFGATMLAMQRAVAGLKLKPGIVLIDGNRMPKLALPARTIVKGDAKIRVISAASILAKVARDEAMLKYHDQFPQYGFDANKGYLTESHLAALKQFGPCAIHRQNYEPIRILLNPATGQEQQFAFMTDDRDECEFDPDASALERASSSTGVIGDPGGSPAHSARIS
jgi:ribonuclease HII